MQQAFDFLEECEVLSDLVQTLDPAAFDQPTLFKNWTVNEILVHLHFWNQAADLSLQDPEGFQDMYRQLQGALKAGKLRNYENGQVAERGGELVLLWQSFFRDMAGRWKDVDPKTRVQWAGPEMSVRSSMSARQMETWAHGQAVFDLAGRVRPESDRIRNIVILGVNAFGWSHKVHGLKVPEAMPKLVLKAPSGAVWEFGDGPGEITGDAVGFCQVVTQTRNVADAGLKVSGAVAGTWMANAQCFAGPPEKPPAPGVRTGA